MAKPKHGRWSHHAGPISTHPSSDAHPTPPSPDPISHDHHPRRCRPPLSRSSPRFPSPAVLSALALFATTPPAVAGGPLPLPTPPPTFLCPFIERDNIQSSQHPLTPRAAIQSSSVPSPTPAPSQYVKRAKVADKYVQGSDNLWRKTNAWTLYGSTCCRGVVTSSAPLQPSSSQSPSPLATTAQFDTSALPAGWAGTTNVNSTAESTIILSLAIVLAGSICVFMIVCVIWRKRKKRTRDTERKLARKLRADDDSQDHAQEKDAREKTRIWARASARWKSNIRQLARRRRKRPMVPSHRPLSPTFADSPQVSVDTPSTSHRNSLVLQEADSSSPEAVSHLDDEAIERPVVLHDPPHSSSPPTYGASFHPGFSRPPPSSVPTNSSRTSSLDSPHAIQHGGQPPFIEDEPLPYIPPSDGHVATDDKAQLAHIRKLASSPPTTADSAGASTMQSVSAPEWHEVEDDLEDLGIDLSEGPMSFHDLGLPPSFPPPPSKVDVSFGYLDDHPLCHGQGDDTLFAPVLGLSGASLRASPSAPHIDDPGLEPSAPPLEGEDDLFQDWDGTSLYVPDAPTPANVDSTSMNMVESSVSSTMSSTLRASFDLTQQSAARDSILPRYHP